MMDELDAQIRTVLEHSGQPLSPAAVRKALVASGSPAVKIIAERLSALHSTGLIGRWPGATVKYVDMPLPMLAQRRILASLAGGPLSEVGLTKALTRALATDCAAALDALIRQGRVHIHPPRRPAGKPVYGLLAADPLDYLGADLDKLLSRAAGLGFSATQVRDALRRFAGDGSASVGSAPSLPKNADEHILTALHGIEPQAHRGASVSIPSLRRALAGELPDKASFDRALLSLMTAGVIQGQTHAWPSRLSDAQKAELVDNGRGGWFDVILLRRPDKSDTP